MYGKNETYTHGDSYWRSEWQTPVDGELCFCRILSENGFQSFVVLQYKADKDYSGWHSMVADVFIPDIEWNFKLKSNTLDGKSTQHGPMPQLSAYVIAWCPLSSVLEIIDNCYKEEKEEKLYHLM